MKLTKIVKRAFCKENLTKLNEYQIYRNPTLPHPDRKILIDGEEIEYD